MSLPFDYDPFCQLAKHEVLAAATLLEPEIQRIRNACSCEYTTDYASVNLPADIPLQEQILALAQQKKELSLSALVVIGIGGSNLGALAVHEAVHGTLYNEQNPPIKCYWADTIESDYINALLALIKQELQQKKQVLITIISKSGLTVETDANAACFIELLKHYHPDDYHTYIVIISDKDSLLWHRAHMQQFSCLEIPRLVGGRYSVMSAAGLFPLAILGVDVKSLCNGAQQMLDSTLRDGVNATAALSAAILALHYKQGMRIHDTFLFSPVLESLGKWYRQLLGESIGKEYNRAGQRVEIGFTPTVSIGSTDLHSVAQRYLAGPRDSVTTFVSIGTMEHEIVLGSEPLNSTLQGKTFSAILNAVMMGVQRAYQHSKRPYVIWRLPNKHEYALGQFMQWKMLETMYLGFLLGVNPFDQPNVEIYKEETRKILAHE